MREINRVTIRASNICSLCWDGDDLVDWAGGGQRYRLDGSIVPRRFGSTFRFNQSLVSPDGQYAVIYEKLVTKGLVLKDAKLLREINRGYYFANSYEYPVALFALPDGRNAIAHCPDEYNRIEIEDAETGERLTTRQSEPMDFFHSRLQSSPDGRCLLSAGWMWHPFDHFVLFDVGQVLKQPETLDAPLDHDSANTGTGINNAVFQGTNDLILTSDDVFFDAGDEKNTDELLKPDQVGVYNIDDKHYRFIAPLTEPSGLLMPVSDAVVGFYDHPKLIDLCSGEITVRWPELSTGTQNSSIHREETPPLALDAINHRFAVADEEKITVIQIGQ